MKSSFSSLVLGLSVLLLLLLLSGLIVSADHHQVVLKFSEDPVLTGSDVTLYCEKKTKGDAVKAYFYFNETKLGSEPKIMFTISKVQQSDEGLYSCSTDVHGQSPQSRLRVRDPPPTSDPHTTTSSTTSDPHTTTSSTTSDPHTTASYAATAFNTTDVIAPSSFPIITVVAVVCSLVLLILVLVGCLQLWRKQTGRNSLSPPVDVTYADVKIRQTASEKGPAEVTYDQVVIKNKRKAGRRTEQPSDPDVLYSSVRAGI
ncbi:uncharacterized protein [Channa argus]|uniref:uncharacterized protein n=1 Tax=Channa argus TaxID=215402 RepID=UPI003522CDE4